METVCWMKCDKNSETINLCRTCFTAISKNLVPPIAAGLNALHVEKPPPELLALNKLERRLLSKVNVFMTMIILPGGQYAERGLVLNLPTDVRFVMNQVNSVRDLPFCAVKFEAGKAECASTKHIIRPNVVHTAFEWLSRNNGLYSSGDIPLVDITCSRNTNDETVDDMVLEDMENLEESSLIPVDYHSVPQDAMPHNFISVPRSDAPPVHVYDMENGEEMAFPWLFPQGRNGFKEERPYKLSAHMYFRCRLYNRFGHFRKDIMYLLHLAASYDLQCLKREIGTYLRITGTEREGYGSSQMTASYVRNSQRDPDFVKNSYMFMKNIRGTIAYFKDALNNLLAMVRCLGPPTLFITLSADDLHWPELGMLLENLDYHDAARKASFLGSMREDPLMAAIHFERRFDALMKYVINSQEHPIGKVKDFFYRVEFQNRGSCHYHIFFWIENIPQDISCDTRDILVQYIDSVIKTDVPDESDVELCQLVKRLQTHGHSKYCQKTPASFCRFKFPFAPCDRTKLYTHADIIQKRGKFYATKRSANAGFINAYNPVILRHFRFNMDIQLVNNAESVAYYICAYICKSEPDELRNALGNLISAVFPQTENLSAFKKLWKVGTTVLRHRRLTAQEAAFRMSNLKMISTSRTSVYLNARPPQMRFKLLKSKLELEQLPADSTDVFQSNIFDYYMARPQKLNDMSLYYFGSWDTRCPAPKRKMINDARIYISKYDIWFTKRRKNHAIVRYPKYPVHSEEYYYSLLVLLLPHRSEEEILSPYETAEDAFVNKRHLLDTAIDFTYFSFTDDVDNAMRRINHFRDEMRHQELEANDAAVGSSVTVHSSSESVHDVDQITESDNIDCNNNKANGDNFESSIHEHLLTDDDDYIHHDIHCRMSLSDMETALKSLTNCQRNVYKTVENHYQSMLTNPPLYMFISGAGGVGKSYIVNLIISYIERKAVFLGKLPVKVCAPTGTAARNIRGQTIHSLLKISLNLYSDYKPVHPYTLQLLRLEFQGVHTIFIDEVSMVSDQMLTIISRRLGEIMDKDIPFGGLNVILVGDIFQLRPVKGSPVFENQLLWRLFQPYYLRENVRQIADPAYGRLLSRVRLGLVMPQDIAALKQRLINVETDDKPHILHIYPTRKEVKEYNSMRQKHLKTETVEIKAEHFFSSTDTNSGGEVDDQYIPNDDRIAGNLPHTLQLSVGSRVMLIRNLMTAKGLVNGAIGTITSVDMIGRYITTLAILFDDKTVGQLNSGLDGTHEPVTIERIDHTYMYLGRNIVRGTFPVMPCWACTVHKVQGMTFDEICVDIGSSVF